MKAEAALKAALALVAVPTHIKAARAADLPEGLDLVLNIAAGDDAARRSAAQALQRSEDEISAASAFFIEQVLLFPGSDSYRVLGASPSATPGELRANMALLMRWLHPDVRSSKTREALANRVLAAWEDVKTSERRAAYDETQSRSQHTALARRAPRRRNNAQRRAKPGFFNRLLWALKRRLTKPGR